MSVASAFNSWRRANEAWSEMQFDRLVLV